MFKLIPIILLGIFLSFLISQRDKELSLKNNDCVKEKQFTIILIFALGIFTGLRTFYNDTITYIGVYENLTPTLPKLFSNFDVSFFEAIGFTVFNSFLKTIGASTQDFIMIYALVTMALYITFFHRYSKSLPFTMYLFFFFGGFIFAQAAIKQSMAMALGCWCFNFAVERKWKKFILTTVIASLFHPFAIIYFLIPFMTFKPWSGKTYFWIIGSIAVSLSLDTLFGTIVDITDIMGAPYDENSFSGEGVNIFRVLVCFVPTILSFLFKERLHSDENRTANLMMNLTMLNGLIMFVGIFGTANYFARLANFFLPFQLIAIPWITSKMNREDKILVTAIALIGYFLFFAYENAAGFCLNISGSIEFM